MRVYIHGMRKVQLSECMIMQDHCGKLESSHEQTSKSSLLVWRLAVGSHPPGGGKETVGFWIWWRLAKGNIPPGDGDEIRSLLEHVRLAVWVVPLSDG